MNREELKIELQKLRDLKGNVISFYSRESYLKKHSLWDALQEHAHHMKPLYQIWEILLDANPECIVCGKLCKMNSEGQEKSFYKTCSWKCMGIAKKGKPANHKDEAAASEKRKQTMLEKYGYTTNSQRPEIREKLKQQHTTKVDKYGEDYAKESARKSRDNWYSLHPEEIYPSDKQHWTSKGEQGIVNWLRELGYEVKHKDHKLLDGREADIYIPSHNLAIEYDGIWWHREDSKLYVKQEEAAKKGVRLIRIFEDEWEQKQPIIKSIILAKLGKFEHRYYARKLDKKEVSGKEAYAFMLENHLQGPKSTQRHIALCDDSENIAMASISTKNELERFATKLNCQVVGGLAKLISNEHDLFTYVDRRFSPIAEETGYNQMGQFLGSTQPGYFWVKNNHREPRWQFQKHKLEKKLGHEVDLTKTETQIMEEEGYYKLYDCGHWKFLLNPSS